MPLSARPRKGRLSVREMAVFAMFGVLMYASKAAMEPIPNVHPLGMLTMTLTLVYRGRALYPIYAYVLLNGILAGFAPWWLPYLYLWAILWAVTMLLPGKMKRTTAAIVCPLVCALHGLAFGTLYAPSQALMYGLDWDAMVAWIIAGLPWDAVHAAGNLAMGLLIVPLTTLTARLSRLAGVPCSAPDWAQP